MGFQKFKFLGDLVVIQQYKKGNLGDEMTSVSLELCDELGKIRFPCKEIAIVTVRLL